MSSSALAACLRHLRTKLAAQERSEDSDEQLLIAFTTRREDSAFDTLVHRHGAMVLHVCRRVLGHEQDAEDAFQATFLVLARHAAKLRKKASLASFLHGTAYRIALKAKQSAARRRKHEGQAPPRAAVTPADEVSWREVQALVDEEIAQLPEVNRSVFILCCLENVSRAEAARRLGLKEGTLSSRLAKARKRLGQRLARRGVELSAVLATFALVEAPASALPVVPVTSITGATVSPAVTALAEGISPLLGLGKSKIVAVIVLAATLLGGAGGWFAQSRMEKESVARRGVSPPVRAESGGLTPRRAPETVAIHGRVLDPDGKPIQGARLYWPRLPKTPVRSEDDIEFTQPAKSDADGRFRFELPTADLRAEQKFPVLAAADGFGVDWAELPKADAPAELTLRLVKDQPIEGRIISTEGKPLAGVRVRALGVSKPPQERLDDFLTLWKNDWQKARQQIASPPQVMLLPPDEKVSQAVTDKDGRFRVCGAGCERIVLLRLHGSVVSQTTLHVITRAGCDAAPINKVVLDRTPSEERRLSQLVLLHGPTIEYVAPASRRIEGTVREAGTGKSVPGFVIFCVSGLDDIVHAVADKDGRYKLDGMPKKDQYVLTAEPPANSSWLRAGARIQDKEGLQSIAVDFTVARGIVVKGRIRDHATGNGVRGHLRFAPLPQNSFAGKPGYDSYKYESLTQTVDADGRFQMAVIPGPGVLMAQAGYGSVTANGGLKLNPYKPAEFDAKEREHVKVAESADGDRRFTAIDNRPEFLGIQAAVKYLDLAPNAGPAKCDLFVERGATRTIRIEDEDGKPLKGTIVAGVTALHPITFTIKDATCTVFALDPNKPRRLYFLHAQRKLAGSLVVRGDENEPVIVRLGPAGVVMGRVLEGDGQPLVGANVNLSWQDRIGNDLDRFDRQRSTVRTDKDGRFRLDGIVPEVKFRVGIVRGRTFFVGEPGIGSRQVKAGETLDLGDVRVKPGP
ncbi:MAG: sigma-70 family RNA polymerase sigma factor [Gemmataceae bacterium]